MNKTQIEWVTNPDGSQGYTWNPITGCLNGCEYCYARKLANGRLKSRYLFNPNVAGYDVDKLTGRQKIDILEDPFYPRFWEDRLAEPYHLGKGQFGLATRPRGIFTCDMSDLFGIGIPKEWTEAVLAVIEDNPQHRFYLLTKQPQNLIKFSPFPDNCFIGVSATTQRQYVEVLPYLTSVKAAVKYVSFEPLLDSVMPSDWIVDDDGSMQDWAILRIAGIKWVIIGSQTKPYKPPKIEWVEEVVQACDKAGIPVFLKNNLSTLLPEQDPLFCKNQYELRQEIPNE